MPNYNLKFGTTEVAKILQVERDTIKNWAYKFSDYLSPKANPPKGEVREFTLDDVRVFSYIFMYWEEEPDFEDIRYGLNSNNHYEYPYDKFILDVAENIKTKDKIFLLAQSYMPAQDIHIVKNPKGGAWYSLKDLNTQLYTPPVIPMALLREEV